MSTRLTSFVILTLTKISGRHNNYHTCLIYKTREKKILEFKLKKKTKKRFEDFSFCSI